MRRLPVYPMLITLLVSFATYLGCDPNQVQQHLQQAADQAAQSAQSGQTPGGWPVSTNFPSGGGVPAQSTSSQPVGGQLPSGVPTPTVSSTVPPRTQGTILIASFNMQRLGPSKLRNPWVMERFADIIRFFDVVALQEITSSDQNTVPALLQYVNRDGARYHYTISPRIGRAASGYYEQYAFVYDTNRIFTSAEASYVIQDPEDVLHREPFVGRFSTTVQGAQPFTFTLINIHTDPDEVATELNVLATVYMNVSQFEYPEDDVLLLGDLNADPRGFRQLGQVPDIFPTIQNIPTNTRGTKTLDNILINRRHTTEFSGRAGILDLRSTWGISQSDAEKISDHMPVWAEFSIVEARGNFANAPAGSVTR
jgi:deoxyribonuclease-1-like protein